MKISFEPANSTIMLFKFFLLKKILTHDNNLIIIIIPYSFSFVLCKDSLVIFFFSQNKDLGEHENAKISFRIEIENVFFLLKFEILFYFILFILVFLNYF